MFQFLTSMLQTLVQPNILQETWLQLKLYVNSHTLRIYDSNTLLLPVDRPPRQKLNREIQELITVLNQMDPRDIYRTFHSITHKIKTF